MAPEIELTSSKLEEIKDNCLVIAFFEDKLKPNNEINKLDNEINNVISNSIKNKDFKAEENEIRLFYLNNNLKYFDFMGAGKPTDTYGVREFKSKFGGELVNYGRFVNINNPFLFKVGKIGLHLLGLIR
ncbi:MAG: hypothetical protein IH949_07305 [Bacteroidetes bacterium]|nr:hypothetical protein [Bacteroidota bacterium]